MTIIKEICITICVLISVCAQIKAPTSSRSPSSSHHPLSGGISKQASIGMPRLGSSLSLASRGSSASSSSAAHTIMNSARGSQTNINSIRAPPSPNAQPENTNVVQSGRGPPIHLRQVNIYVLVQFN